MPIIHNIIDNILIKMLWRNTQGGFGSAKQIRNNENKPSQCLRA